MIHLSHKRTLLACLGAGVVGLAACGDDAASSSSSGSTTSSASSSGGDGGGSSTSSTSSSSSGGDGGSDAQVSVPGITVSAPSKTQTTEDGDKVTFTVALKSKPTGDVTIALTSDKVAEGTVDKATLTFTAANFDTPQTVTVTGVDDEIDDGDQDYKISMAVTSTDTGYAAITPTPVALKNMDNDTAGIIVGAATPNKNTTEKGGKVTFTVRLRSKPSADVTVPVLSDTVTEGTADKASLTFTAANYKVEQTVTVTGADEVAPDGDKNYKVKLGKTTSSDALYKDLEASVDLTNVDDDMPMQVVGNWGTHCVRFVDGNAKCWGRNDHGPLGQGDTTRRGDNPNEMGPNLPMMNFGTGRTVKLLASNMRGEGNMCAILDNDKVKCWGANYVGQLGLGDVNNRGDNANEMGDNLPYVDLGTNRTAKLVVVNETAACALLDDNTVKCWGNGFNGQQGRANGSTANVGSGANQMGDNNPIVSLGAGRTAKSITAGQNFFCAILDNNTVKCWGQNNYGQLGLGDTNYRGDQANEMGDNLPVVNLGTNRTAKYISGGLDFACAILDNDTLKCWGRNDWGNLGQGNTTVLGNAPNQMGDNLPVINLGAGRTAKTVSAGWASVCANLDNGTLKCWGNNSQGELGLGDTNNRGDQANEMGDNLPVVNLGAGRTVARTVEQGTHARCAILDNGVVKCWGYNDWGWLGQGDQLVRGDQANEMGDNLLPIVLK
ncbi:MAG: hypothetical protein U0174_15910 [Polyangiaceae bacterium]